MTRIATIALLFFQILTVGISTVVAQERDISKQEFWEFFRRSREATKDVPFRERVTVEMGDLPNGPWKPSTSWVMENVFPDVARTIYTSGQTGEFLSVGKSNYRKDADDRWVSTQEQTLRFSPPASHFAYEPPVYIDFIGTEKEGDKFQIRVVSRAKPGTDVDQQRRTYLYSFDEKGVLVQSETIIFKESTWVRRIERFEYDPSIKIEAPIK